MSTFIPSTPTFAPSTSLKRKRDSALPPTPPLAAVDDRASHETLRLVGHVLATEAAALSSLAIRYQEKIDAKHGFLRAVDCICAAVHAHHKVVVCGVGKSGIVGMKLVATMKSLGIASSFLHAGEAQHGDLGDIRPVCCARIECHLHDILMLRIHWLTNDFSRVMPFFSSPSPARLKSFSACYRTFTRRPQ